MSIAITKPPRPSTAANPPAVLFKFRADVAEAHRAKFVEEVSALRDLPCVRDRQLWVGGPSITTPIEKSKGFQHALVSFHASPEALAAYQASEEHERYVGTEDWVYDVTADLDRVTSTYLWPYKEDVTRFDFEISEEDPGVLQKMAKSIVGGL